MAYDACRALKLESPTTGGTQFDFLPTELNPLQDALLAVGLYVQDSSAASIDKSVLIDRIGSALRLTDTTTSHVLGELVSSTPNQVGSHNALLDSIHYIADAGPADAYPSGTYCVVTNAGPLVTSRVWYTSQAMTTRIYGVSYTYVGPLVSTITRTLYNASNAAIRTFVDTISRTGPIQTGATRTYS